MEQKTINHVLVWLKGSVVTCVIATLGFFVLVGGYKQKVDAMEANQKQFNAVIEKLHQADEETKIQCATTAARIIEMDNTLKRNNQILQQLVAALTTKKTP